MFYSIDDFKFLKPILNAKNFIHSEYLNYKNAIKTQEEFAVQNEHLNNLEKYDLITSFGTVIYSVHNEGEGQVTNGLFNFNYTMPDRNFVKFKPFLEKKFNIYYNTPNDKGIAFFEKTLDSIKNIPNLVQCGFGEFKPTCFFDPHKHEKVMVFHILLNDDNNKMHIECNGSNTTLCCKSPYVIFKGDCTHSARMESKSNMLTFVTSFYY